MTPLYAQALAFAEEAHAGQTRATGPDSTEPYIEHPRRVAAMVWDLTQDDELAAVAALHDVIEDCDVSPSDIEFAFGSRVLQIVGSLTDHYTPERYPDDNRGVRKQSETWRLSGCLWQTRLIKLCDCIDNARSIETKGGGFVEVWRSELAYLLPKLMGER